MSGEMEHLTAQRLEKQRILNEQAEHLRQARQRGEQLALLNKALEPEKFEPGALLPCFTADTPVWTTSGPKPIGELRKGDHVLAFDIRYARVVSRPILHIFTNQALRLYDITIGETIVGATGSHRFWVDDLTQWVAARELRQGMHLRTMAGARVAIDSVVRRDVIETVTLNLHVEECSTYFIQPGILVHNQGPVAYDFGPYMIMDTLEKDIAAKREVLEAGFCQ